MGITLHKISNMHAKPLYKTFDEYFAKNKIPSLKHQYVAYDVLKSQLLKTSQSTQRYRAFPWVTEDPHYIREVNIKAEQKLFFQLVERELQRVDNFVVSSIAELTNSLQVIERNAESGYDQVLSDVEREVNDVSERMIMMDSFILVNYNAFRRIMALHDHVTGLSMSSWMSTRLSQAKFVRVKFDELILSMSMIHTSLRAIRNPENTKKEDGEWKAPESFVRKTTKYILRPCDLLRVKCMIVPHLPVLIFNAGDKKKRRKTRLMLEVGKDVSDSSLITSVYCDNRKHTAYHSRIDRKEGATLIRLRWYGSKRAPKGTREMYVERKTHHETWVKEDSVKERFPIQEKYLTPFITGRWTLDEIKARLMDDGNSAAKVEAMLSLATELQDEILERTFEPVLRTVYRRCAFQLPTTNAVRISIDTDLYLVNERALGRGAMEWKSVIEDVEDNDAVAFPFCILEVKLTTDKPIEWVAELLESGLLQPVPKFSKFMHGSALHHSARLNCLPPWWDILKSAKAADWDSHDDERANKRMAKLSHLSLLQPVNVADADIERTVSSRHVQHDDDNDDNDDDESSHASDVPKGTELQPLGVQSTLMRRRFGGADDDDRLPAFKRQPLKLPVKIEPKTFFANERTFLQWLNTLLLLAVGSSAFIAYGSAPFQIAGTLLVVVALLFVCYALAVYHWRRRAIVRRLATKSYDDRFGPTALVTLVVVTFIMSIVLQFAINPASQLQVEPGATTAISASPTAMP